LQVNEKNKKQKAKAKTKNRISWSTSFSGDAAFLDRRTSSATPHWRLCPEK
jgi:hypothetical protein